MKKYEIYQLGKLPPLTIVEADFWYIDNDNNLIFQLENHTVAKFNWCNIAGFREVTE